MSSAGTHHAIKVVIVVHTISSSIKIDVLLVVLRLISCTSNRAKALREQSHGGHERFRSEKEKREEGIYEVEIGLAQAQDNQQCANSCVDSLTTWNVTR